MSTQVRGRRFAKTHWSVVLAAADSASPGGRAALAHLCEIYWYPVYTFIRSSGCAADDAGDLTQDFFARLLEKGWLEHVRPEKGRFRAFLLTAVRHFLSNDRDRCRALKRGAGVPPLPLCVDDGERRYQIEPVETATPEHIYERRWALATLDLAVARLAAEQDTDGRRAIFERLKPFLTGDDASTSYASVATAMNISEGAVSVAVHRLRQQFGTALREVIAETVASDDEVVDELRYLIAVMRR